MHQFFVKKEQVGKEYITIEGQDVNHIRQVLRMKLGEIVRISDDLGKSYLCKLAEVADTYVHCDILEDEVKETELQKKIYLFQALPKGDRMETVIEKAVELGVYEIIPVAMKYCVVKLDGKKEQNKLKRWQALSETAAKQSKRSRIPEIHSVMSYKEAVAYGQALGLCVLPYENQLGMKHTKEMLNHLKDHENICIFIGPEGGFAPEEIEIARDMEMDIVSLGSRILRTDTAGICIMSMMMLQLECDKEDK